MKEESTRDIGQDIMKMVSNEIKSQVDEFKIQPAKDKKATM